MNPVPRIVTCLEIMRSPVYARNPYNLEVSIAPTPARIQLPPLPHPPATVFEFLCAHFPHIPVDTWRTRIADGAVRITDPGSLLTLETSYKAGATVFYFREVTEELRIPFDETVIYEDDRILVADKPHFLPVTPAGGAVIECLLFRLQRRTGLDDLAPAHRLDRDTAGLVLFVKQRADRALYAQLFATSQVERKYWAVAKISDHAPQEFSVKSRIEPEPGSFRMRSVPGEANAVTKIILHEVREGLGLFGLHPLTGKKHQLRVHMMSLGLPILHDPFYPELTPRKARDFSQPLQLVASELTFADPTRHAVVTFHTQQRLIFASAPALRGRDHPKNTQS